MRAALVWWWAGRCNAYESNYWGYVRSWERYLLLLEPTSRGR